VQAVSKDAVATVAIKANFARMEGLCLHRSSIDRNRLVASVGFRAAIAFYQGRPAVGQYRSPVVGGFGAGCLHQYDDVSLNESVACKPGHAQATSAPFQPTNSGNEFWVRFSVPPHRIACHA